MWNLFFLLCMRLLACRFRGRHSESLARFFFFFFYAGCPSWHNPLVFFLSWLVAVVMGFGDRTEIEPAPSARKASSSLTFRLRKAQNYSSVYYTFQFFSHLFHVSIFPSSVCSDWDLFFEHSIMFGNDYLFSLNHSTVQSRHLRSNIISTPIACVRVYVSPCQLLFATSFRMEGYKHARTSARIYISLLAR